MGNKSDNYCFERCVDGHCPIVIEEEIYGCCTSDCSDYCGNVFHGCDFCYFYGSDFCNDCIHEEVFNNGKS